VQGLLTAMSDVLYVGVFRRHFANRRDDDTKWFIFIFATNWYVTQSSQNQYK
jgi:hypothetical protein